MLIFGITGGSGAGKSDVSDIFRDLGVFVIDADAVAHDITRKNKDCIAEIRQEFSDSVINDDGTLNRKKLGNFVFSDNDKLKCLNKITHKYIKEEILSQLSKSGAALAAIDGAVIIGSEIENLCKFMISVVADRETRLKRIMRRDIIERGNAENRLNSQPDDDFYISHSSYIISNNSSRDSLKTQVKELYDKILKNEV